MPDDIRDKESVHHRDIISLRFIRAPGTYVYRRHYRQGLRSHIMEMLRPGDVEKEAQGVLTDGARHYPKAEPLKMLRIFRTRFTGLEEATQEVQRVKLIAAYLAPDHLGRPEEFLVHDVRHGKQELLLCGLQEYVKGEILDPWGLLDRDHLAAMGHDMGLCSSEEAATEREQWLGRLYQQAERLVKKVKQMIFEAHHIPDLAGIGNLLVTRAGQIKLVDINNISRVTLGPDIVLDDRGYPVCDKSMEALFLLEKQLLGRACLGDDPVYRVYLDPKRMKEVQAIEKAFHCSTTTPSYPSCAA